ncbi:MAG: hypothetical protein GTN69_03420 [Armatimonadetes bacterium]|nr:hypothetical protein [Armatimonadota bacterium]
MKLQYRDGWPTAREVVEHGRVHGMFGNPLLGQWMIRIVYDDGPREPRVFEMQVSDGAVVVDGWRGDQEFLPVSELANGVQCAPIDRDGNAVEWPTFKT